MLGQNFAHCVARFAVVGVQGSIAERDKNSHEIKTMLLVAENFLHPFRGELKAPGSLIEGHVPDAILKVERGRFPRAVSQAAPGRSGYRPRRHYDRRTRCLA